MVGETHIPRLATKQTLFSRKEAAALLSVSERTLIRATQNGDLRETRLPSGRGYRGIIRYSLDAIEAFEKSRSRR